MDAQAAMARLDGWINAITGMGIWGRDKTRHTKFEVCPVDVETALALWRGDPIGARFVETIPNEALRQGFEVCIGDADVDATAPASAAGKPKPPAPLGKKDRQDAATEAKPLQETIAKRLDDLGAATAIKEAMCYERAYGGGAILIGANDFTTDLRQPLDMSKVRSLDWLTPLEARELVPLYYYNNPRAPKFGQPAIYQLVPYVMGASVDDYYPEITEIHESRLIVFPGVRVSRRAMSTGFMGWGDSIFTRVLQALTDWNSAGQGASVLLSDFAQAIYKIKNLPELLAQETAGSTAGTLSDRMQIVDMMRSLVRAIIVDADGEDFERKSTPMTGYPETLDRLSQRLAAAGDMPLTLLLGISPAGLTATGDSDIRFFYDRVGSVRNLRVAPALRRLVEIELVTLGCDPATVNHSIRFPALWQPTDKESAEARFIQAQADQIYLNLDVVSPEEIAQSRFGGDQFSFETRIDFDARAAQEAVAPPPVTPNNGVSAPTLNESSPMPEAAKHPTLEPVKPPFPLEE